MKPGTAVVALALLASAQSVATADVVMTETLAMKVARSGVVALARFVSFQGPGPFTNQRPPTATLRVIRAFRGCRVGEDVRVGGWDRSNPPEPRGGPRPPSADEVRAAHDAWAATVIPSPGAGAEFLLLLDRPAGAGGGATAATMQMPFPDHLAAPDARTLEMVAGLGSFGIEVSTPEQIQVGPGQPVTLTVTVQNQTREAARFEPASLRLSATTPRGDRLDAAAPAAGQGGLPGIALAAGENRAYTWSLSALYPSLFVDPGDYWLEIEVPAQGGDRIARHVEVAEPTLEYACGRAALILRTRVAAGQAGQVALDDPIYLRLRGERLPRFVAWPAGTPLPAAGQRVFACGSLAGVSWVAPDGAQARQVIQRLLDGDPPDLWPRDEESDPRFAPPPDLPGSEQRRIGIDKRLNAP
jgi:hypothetical protein